MQVVDPVTFAEYEPDVHDLQKLAPLASLYWPPSETTISDSSRDVTRTLASHADGRAARGRDLARRAVDADQTDLDCSFQALRASHVAAALRDLAAGTP